MIVFGVSPCPRRCFSDPDNADYWATVKLASSVGGVPFDEAAALRDAALGKYLLFTVRAEGSLVGSCGVYLRGEWAQEDFLYLDPQFREPGLARAFLAFGEGVLLRHTAVSEFRCRVAPGAMVRFMRRAGYSGPCEQMTKKVAR